jgi:tetratricopeptide (TPR) repeat protein
MTADSVTRKDRSAVLLLARGTQCLEAGDSKGALDAYLAGMRQYPREWRFPFNAATLYYRERRMADAFRLLNVALQVEPTSSSIHQRLGAWMLEMGQLETGLSVLERAVHLDGENLESLLQLGTAYLETRQAERAEELADRAVAIHSDQAGAYLLLGFVLSARGRIEESDRALLHSIELDPSNGQACYHLARRGKLDDTESIEKLLARTDLPVDSTRRLHFALGEIHDHARRFEPAFEHFERANSLSSTRWQPELNHQLLLGIAEASPAAHLAELSASGRKGSAPIFIVGMPRSGSSLLDQILARHPEVHAIGEHTFGLPRIASELPEIRRGLRGFPAGLADLTPDDAGSLRQRYLDSIESAPREGLRVVDKNLSSFQMLGLIAAMFPDAKILNCRRDPRDCGLSAYFIQFYRNELPWAYDLNHIAGYYEGYSLLMSYWRECLPLPIMDVRYEELVANPEEWTRRVLEFCELDWDEACTSYEDSGRAVFTASQFQVREKPHTRAVGRWKGYEAHLGPLRALGAEYER